MSRSPQYGRHPAGFTLIELMAAIGVLMTLFLIATPALVAISRERIRSAQQHVALQQAANLLEDLTTRPWSELTAETPPKLPEATASARALSGFEQTVTVQPDESVSSSRRIDVEVSWKTQPAVDLRQRLTLSAWVYPPQETQP